MRKTKLLSTAALLLALFSSTAAMGQQSSSNDNEWLKDLTDRVQLHGYAQGGFNYTHKDGEDTQTFDLKRILFWTNAQITDRWSFLFMHDFSSVVQEYYTDFRISNNKALTVRLGQFKNALSYENPLSPTSMEAIDVYSEAVTFLTGCGSDPLLGVQYGRDLGLAVFGETNDGKVRYELNVMNGQGINKKDGNDDKDVIVKLDYRPAKGFRIVASAQKGRGHAVGTCAWNPDIQVGDDYRRDRVSLGGELKTGQYAPGEYKEARPVSIRAEYLVGKDGDVTSHGGYVTTSIPLIAGIDAVGSVDYFNRNTSMKYYQTQTTAGLQYWFYKNCRVQLQYTRTFSNYQKDYNWLQGQVQVAF